jgi:hypothetical protein
MSNVSDLLGTIPSLTLLGKLPFFGGAGPTRQSVQSRPLLDYSNVDRLRIIPMLII